jgi:hypothetical protein
MQRRVDCSPARWAKLGAAASTALDGTGTGTSSRAKRYSMLHQQSEDGTMRKFLIGATALAAFAVAPSIASAQASTAGGVAVGAGTGFLIGGPPGAVVGGIIGGGVGAAAEPRGYVYVEPQARVRYQPQQVCWRDNWNRTVCQYR